MVINPYLIDLHLIGLTINVQLFANVTQMLNSKQTGFIKKKNLIKQGQ